MAPELLGDDGPEVLLLDEPLPNLDAKLRRHVREEIRQIQQRLGLAAVYGTYDQEEAMTVSDRIIVMNNAEIAPAKLVLRPHQVRLSKEAGPASLPAEISYAAYLGNCIQYTLTTDAGYFRDPSACGLSLLAGRYGPRDMGSGRSASGAALIASRTGAT